MKGVILLGLCLLVAFAEAISYQGFVVNEPFAPYPVVYSEPLRIRRSPIGGVGGGGYRRPGGGSISSSQSSSSSTSVSGGFGGGSVSQSGASSSSISSSGGGYGGNRYHGKR